MDATAAGDDCYNGADGDAALLARSAAERTKLVTLLAAAVQRVEPTSPASTPTTDTTVPPTGGGDPFAGGQ